MWSRTSTRPSGSTRPASRPTWNAAGRSGPREYARAVRDFEETRRRALAAATTAWELTGWKGPKALDVLAECGRFDDAAGRAAAESPARSRGPPADQVRARLELYRAGKP